MNQILLKFGNEFAGTMETSKSELKIGTNQGEVLPYEMLMGALGSCLYSTFLDVVKKMRLEFTTCSFEISWEKRTEVPTTVKLVEVKCKLSANDPAKEEKFKRALELATEHCSIYHTLSKVAEMKWELQFEY